MNTNKIIQHSSSTVSAVEFDYIKALAKRNYVGHGINCLALKKALAEYSKKTGIVLTHNGQAAVELALQRLKILYPKKNEVIVSGYVCPAVINAILSCSLKPIFADIEVNSFNIRVEDILNSCLSSKTLAIICTNTGGFPDDYISLLKLKIPIISDCAQAIGSSINNFPLISLGMMSIVSFGPTKMITAGCGGALICEKNNYESIEKAASPELSVKEYFKNGFLPTIGQHFSDLNAGLAFSQLGRLNEFIKKRHIIAMKYYEILKPFIKIKFPEIVKEGKPNYFRFYFISENAPFLIKILRQNGIDARSSIAHVIIDYFPKTNKCVNLKRMANKMVSLPIYPGLSNLNINQILQTLQLSLRKG